MRKRWPNDLNSRLYAFVAQSVLRAGWLAAGSVDAQDVCAYRVRVLAGPLRGARLCMPRLERPSYVLGCYEPHVVENIQRYARPGMIAYDVGAHIGYAALILSQAAGPSGHVLAFEADPTNYKALCHNVTANARKHAATVTPIPQAVSDMTEEVTFASFRTYSTVGHIATATTPDDATLLRVPAVALDDLVTSGDMLAPHIMLIDVEGAEARVLRGAAQLLREARPIVICEVRQASTWPIVQRLMMEVDYTGELLAPWTEGVAEALFVPLGDRAT